MATHSSILVWRIPRTEEPGGLQPTAHVTGILQWQPVNFASSFSSFLFSDLVFVLGGVQTAPTFFSGSASMSAPALGCWPGTCWLVG